MTEPKYPDLLAWVDVETTDLDPAKGSILELAIILTDGHLVEQNRASWVVHFPRRSLPDVNDWSLRQHAASGLLHEAFQSSVSSEAVMNQARSWLDRKTPFNALGKVPMAGASVHFDRGWLARHMPDLEKGFYYGNLDVSTIEKLARLWWPELAPWPDSEVHRALPDCEDAIAELKYYLNAGVVRMPMEMGSAPDPELDPDGRNGVALEFDRQAGGTG